ncbi:MAG TPA: dual specificity protein phosphatase family protein [Acidimicrobiales bacterium]|nr:dual specificity protein phosphatase family protein [Acidimicrobiales bacterium]
MRRAKTTKVVVGTLAASIAFLVLGNVAILVASKWASSTTEVIRIESIRGIDNLEAVDSKLWRGGAPSEEGYRNLAAAGTKTIVDLRAEEGVERDNAIVESLGMRLIRIPVRDGQTPSSSQIGAFLEATNQSDGPVFVHCGAGVGRTGAMVGAYTVASGELDAGDAVRRNLAVGPPSLEQIAFVAGLDSDDIDRPHVAVRAVSRVLDSPRRIWHNLGL